MKRLCPFANSSSTMTHTSLFTIDSGASDTLIPDKLKPTRGRYLPKGFISAERWTGQNPCAEGSSKTYGFMKSRDFSWENTHSNLILTYFFLQEMPTAILPSFYLKCHAVAVVQNWSLRTCKNYHLWTMRRRTSKMRRMLHTLTALILPEMAWQLHLDNWWEPAWGLQVDLWWEPVWGLQEDSWWGSCSSAPCPAVFHHQERAFGEASPVLQSRTPATMQSLLCPVHLPTPVPMLHPAVGKSNSKPPLKF